MSYFNRSMRHPRIHNINKRDFQLAIKAFAITNFVLWLGNIAYVVMTGELIFPVAIFDMDLGILFMYTAYYSAITNPTIMIMVGIGWFLSGVYVQREAPDNSTRVIIYAALVPVISYLIILLIILVPLLMSISGLGLIILGLIAVGVSLIGIVGIFLAIPAFISAGFANFDSRLDPVNQSLPAFLLLVGPVPPLHNEPVQYCPFRMKDQPGCAFLGYKTVDKPLICDYKSKWISCYVYAHIYGSLDEEFKERK